MWPALFVGNKSYQLELEVAKIDPTLHVFKLTVKVPKKTMKSDNLCLWILLYVK
jgi:hypothetical protein